MISFQAVELTNVLTFAVVQRCLLLKHQQVFLSRYTRFVTIIAPVNDILNLMKSEAVASERHMTILVSVLPDAEKPIGGKSARANRDVELDMIMC